MENNFTRSHDIDQETHARLLIILSYLSYFCRLNNPNRDVSDSNVEGAQYPLMDGIVEKGSKLYAEWQIHMNPYES